MVMACQPTGAIRVCQDVANRSGSTITLAEQPGFITKAPGLTTPWGRFNTTVVVMGWVPRALYRRHTKRGEDALNSAGTITVKTQTERTLPQAPGAGAEQR